MVKMEIFSILGMFVLSCLAYPTIRDETSANKNIDEVVKEVFEIGEMNSTYVYGVDDRRAKSFSQNFDFTVKRNSEGKLNIAVFENTNINRTVKNTTRIVNNFDYLQMSTGQDKYQTKPICKEEVNFFCTKVENYPAERITSILDNLGINIESYFGDDVISETMSNISQRIDPGEETLCRSEEQLIHPEGLWGVDGNLEYIVNDQKYKQGVRIEQCVYNNKNDKRCQMTDSFPNGYVTECKQRYISRHLLTYNADGRTIEKKLFKIPSCCQCVVRNEH